MTTGSGEWSFDRIPSGSFTPGIFSRPVTASDLQRLVPLKPRATFDQLLMRGGAVLLCIAISGFGLARLAKAGDERLWTEI